MTRLLDCESLTVKRQARTLLQDLDWQVNAGEFWGVLGINGSGKTSLLHTLAGLLSHAKGEILLSGKARSHYSRKKLAQQIGLLLQQTHTQFPCSVYESVLHGRYPYLSSWQHYSSEDQQATKGALNTMDLEHLQERDFNTLSGGEQRRVSIATLLNQDPKLFLLDEPINHLDIKHQIQALSFFTQLCSKQEQAVITTLHDINLASRFCSHLLMIFPDGSHQLGNKENLLTAENLATLYEQHFSAIQSPGGTLWLATDRS